MVHASEASRLINASEEDVEELKQQPDNSPFIVFSIWATMQGSTLLAMPKFFREAGYIPSIITTAVVASLTFFTCTRVVNLGKKYGFSQEVVLSKVFPNWAKNTSSLMSVFLFTGAMTMYHIYLTDSVMKILSLHKSHHDRPIVAVSLGVFFFCTTVLRKITLLFKASSYTVGVLIYLLIYIIVKSSLVLTGKGHCHGPEAPDGKTYGMGWNGVGPIANLASCQTMSLFIHNAILSIMNNTTRPQHSVRNTAFAYVSAATTYAGPSVLAVIALKQCEHFKSDFLDTFDDGYTISAHVAISILVLIVYPLMLFISREQVLKIKFGDERWHLGYHLACPAVLIVITTLASALHLTPGTVGPAIGIVGTVWNFILPMLMECSDTRQEFGEIPLGVKIRTAVMFVIGGGVMSVTILGLCGVSLGGS